MVLNELIFHSKEVCGLAESVDGDIGSSALVGAVMRVNDEPVEDWLFLVKGGPFLHC